VASLDARAIKVTKRAALQLALAWLYVAIATAIILQQVWRYGPPALTANK